MPDTIQFRNGNQILNYYDAAGQKIFTNYKTLFYKIAVPISEGEIASLPSDVNLVDQTIHHYASNIRYLYHVRDHYAETLDKVYNTEGYAQYANDSYRHYYYRKDHLGNNREVWSVANDSIVQRTQYYPSGLPWAEGLNPGYQNRKYNGKEFIEMHGYDTYDYGARGMYPAIMRFTTIDPLAEKYYSMSPYAYCANNPIRFIDPNGMWLDDYTMDDNGYIKKVRETEDKFDMLYSKKDYEKGKKDNGLKLNKRKSTDKTILADLSEKKTDYRGHYAISTEKEQSFSVFLFAAKNSSVEWSISGFGQGKVDKYLIGTLHSDRESQVTINSKNYNVFNMLFSIHSHPSATGTKGGSYVENFGGDMHHIINLYYRFQEKGINPIYMPKEYVYHKYGKILYNYTPWNPSIYIRPIRKANDLYRGLGF